jgi:transcriptional regulator with GAF, ATPase, and Fis domain
MNHKPSHEKLEKRVTELEQQTDQFQTQKLQYSPEIVSILMETFRYIPHCKTFQDAAKHIFDHFKRLTGACSGYIALLTETGEKNEVLYLDAGGLPCDVDPNLPMPIRGLREIAYKTREVVCDNAFTESPWLKYLPDGHVKLENVLFTPLNIQDKTVGVIGIANKTIGNWFLIVKYPCPHFLSFGFQNGTE